MIKRILQDALKASNSKIGFYTGTKSYQNLQADEATFPMMYLVDPITSFEELFKGGLIESTYPLMIIFADKSEMDWDQVKHDVVIQAMRKASRDFTIALQNNTEFVRYVKKSSTTEFINMFDVNASGVILQIDVTPVTLEGRCLLP